MKLFHILSCYFPGPWILGNFVECKDFRKFPGQSGFSMIFPSFTILIGDQNPYFIKNTDVLNGFSDWTQNPDSISFDSLNKRSFARIIKKNPTFCRSFFLSLFCFSTTQFFELRILVLFPILFLVSQEFYSTIVSTFKVHRKFFLYPHVFAISSASQHTFSEHIHIGYVFTSHICEKNRTQRKMQTKFSREYCAYDQCNSHGILELKFCVCTCVDVCVCARQRMRPRDTICSHPCLESYLLREPLLFSFILLRSLWDSAIRSRKRLALCQISAACAAPEIRNSNSYLRSESKRKLAVHSPGTSDNRSIDILRIRDWHDQPGDGKILSPNLPIRSEWTKHALWRSNCSLHFVPPDQNDIILHFEQKRETCRFNIKKKKRVFESNKWWKTIRNNFSFFLFHA